jgi:hypothetical protein
MIKELTMPVSFLFALKKKKKTLSGSLAWEINQLV